MPKSGHPKFRKLRQRLKYKKSKEAKSNVDEEEAPLAEEELQPVGDQVPPADEELQQEEEQLPPVDDQVQSEMKKKRKKVNVIIFNMCLTSILYNNDPPLIILPTY